MVGQCSFSGRGCMDVVFEVRTMIFTAFPSLSNISFVLSILLWNYMDISPIGQFQSPFLRELCRNHNYGYLFHSKIVSVHSCCPAS